MKASLNVGTTPSPIGWGVWRVAIVVVLGMIMSILDTTIVNVALESLARDLNTSLSEIQWVVTAYLLALAAVIPISGWAARRIGARRLFIVSAVLFTVGSMLCGAATSVTELTIFRVIQGLGGGMLMPVGQMILVKKAGRANLPRVMSAIGVPLILGPVFGPTIGGLLLDNIGWRWIFFVNLPVGIAAVIAAVILLPRDSAENAGRLDVGGLVLAAAGLVALTYGLAETGSSDVGSPHVLAPALIGLALIAIFVVRALRMERPLLDVRLFRNRAFSAASLTTFCLGAAMFGGMILMPLYYQTVRHESAVTTGLLLAPQGVGAAFSMALSGRWVERYGAGLVSFGGGLVSIAATVPFVLIGAHTSYVALSATMVVRGFGMGMASMPAMTAAFRVLEPHQINDAAPQLNVLQRVGGSIGTAILTVILQHHLAGAGSSPSAQGAAFGSTFWWVLAVAAIATVPTLLLIRIERQAPAKGRATQVIPADVLVEVG